MCMLYEIGTGFLYECYAIVIGQVEGTQGGPYCWKRLIESSLTKVREFSHHTLWVNSSYPDIMSFSFQKKISSILLRISYLFMPSLDRKSLHLCWSCLLYEISDFLYSSNIFRHGYCIPSHHYEMIYVMYLIDYDPSINEMEWNAGV